MKKKLTMLALLPLLGLMFSIGCGSQDEPAPNSDSKTGTTAPAHDPDDVPLTESQKDSLRQGVKNYADALARVKSYRDTIRDAVAAGDPTKAHRPLDELDVVLEHLPAVARDNNVPRTEWETVNTSAQQLRDSFNKVHAQIDGGEKPDYQAVSGDIDGAIGRLEAVSAGA
jgi:hypothetical protein